MKLAFNCTAWGNGRAWALIPLVGLLLATAYLAESGNVRTPTGMMRASAVRPLPGSDRVSSLLDPEDRYEMLPNVSYRSAPAAPSGVVATAGGPGSGRVTLSWNQGPGRFQAFLVTDLPTAESISVAGDLRTATFTGLSAGVHTFQVTALGQYDDSKATTSNPVALLPALTAGRPGCGHLIDVNLTTQTLVASSCGTVYLSSPITSGRAGLRTPTGSFPIFLKQRNLTFYSPWPRSSRYYYPPMFVAYAAEFAGGGYYLHTDPGEPLNAYGAGSQDGPYASHGCVHVPSEIMASLYAWAPYGTRVVIHY